MIDDYRKLANAVIKRILTPTDAARLCCTAFVYGEADADKMQQSRQLFEELLSDANPDSVAEAIMTIWKKK